MDQIETVRRRVIARILAVNDTCPHEGHKKAMRSVVMSAVNEAFAEVKGAFADHTPRKGS